MSVDRQHLPVHHLSQVLDVSDVMLGDLKQKHNTDIMPISLAV